VVWAQQYLDALYYFRSPISQPIAISYSLCSVLLQSKYNFREISRVTSSRNYICVDLCLILIFTARRSHHMQALSQPWHSVCCLSVRLSVAHCIQSVSKQRKTGSRVVFAGRKGDSSFLSRISGTVVSKYSYGSGPRQGVRWAWGGGKVRFSAWRWDDTARF